MNYLFAYLLACFIAYLPVYLRTCYHLSTY